MGEGERRYRGWCCSRGLTEKRKAEWWTVDFDGGGGVAGLRSGVKKQGVGC